MLGLCAERGWEYPQARCGHLIGNFPHERIFGDEVVIYITPTTTCGCAASGIDGQPRDWILEIHFVDRSEQIGGFFEQLLTVD